MPIIQSGPIAIETTLFAVIHTHTFCLSAYSIASETVSKHPKSPIAWHRRTRGNSDISPPVPLSGSQNNCGTQTPWHTLRAYLIPPNLLPVSTVSGITKKTGGKNHASDGEAMSTQSPLEKRRAAKHLRDKSVGRLTDEAQALTPAALPARKRKTRNGDVGWTAYPLQHKARWRNDSAAKHLRGNTVGRVTDEARTPVQ